MPGDTGWGSLKPRLGGHWALGLPFPERGVATMPVFQRLLFSSLLACLTSLNAHAICLFSGRHCQPRAMQVFAWEAWEGASQREAEVLPFLATMPVQECLETNQPPPLTPPRHAQNNNEGLSQPFLFTAADCIAASRRHCHAAAAAAACRGHV